jgi:hypothetical protein
MPPHGKAGLGEEEAAFSSWVVEEVASFATLELYLVGVGVEAEICSLEEALVCFGVDRQQVLLVETVVEPPLLPLLLQQFVVAARSVGFCHWVQIVEVPYQKGKR